MKYPVKSNNLYRLECNPKEIGCIVDTNKRNNNSRHPNYGNYSQIMGMVYAQSLLSGQSILQSCPVLAGHFQVLDPWHPQHRDCVSCIWDVAFDLHRPSNINVGRTTCTYFFMDQAACGYYSSYPNMQFAQLCEVEIIEEYDSFIGDMKWIDEIDESTAKAKDIATSAVHYWEGQLTTDPIKEMLFQGKYKLIPM